MKIYKNDLAKILHEFLGFRPLVFFCRMSVDENNLLNNWSFNHGICFKYITIVISADIVACIADIVYIFNNILSIQTCFFYSCQLRCISFNSTIFVTDRILLLWARAFNAFKISLYRIAEMKHFACEKFSKNFHFSKTLLRLRIFFGKRETDSLNFAS